MHCKLFRSAFLESAKKRSKAALKIVYIKGTPAKHCYRQKSKVKKSDFDVNKNEVIRFTLKNSKHMKNKIKSEILSKDLYEQIIIKTFFLHSSVYKLWL
jgi:ribosomal protein S17E